jgi:hypothetical protein
MTLGALYLACAALLGVPQDDKNVERRIAELGDESATVRESALQALIGLGPGVMPALRRAAESADQEVVDRAHYALAELERAVKLEGVLSAHPPLNLVLDGVDFGTALERIQERTGVRFQGLPSVSGVPVTATFKHAPLMEVLDVLGAAAGLQWTFDDARTVSWRRSTPVTRPTCYSGGFKVTLSRIDVYQSWDYQEGRGMLWLYFDACTEPGILPLSAPTFELCDLSDGTLHELPRDVPSVESSFQGVQAPPREPKTGSSYRSNPFLVSPLDRSVRTLAKVSGTVRFLFPLDQTKIAIDDLCEGSSTVRGDFTVQVDEILTNSVKITLKSRAPDALLSRRLEADSIVLVDAEGSERIRGRDFELHIDQMSADTYRFCVDFNDGVAFQPVAIRCMFIESFYEKTIPFEFRNVHLP